MLRHCWHSPSFHSRKHFMNGNIQKTSIDTFFIYISNRIHTLHTELLTMILQKSLKLICQQFETDSWQTSLGNILRSKTFVNKLKRYSQWYWITVNPNTIKIWISKYGRESIAFFVWWFNWTWHIYDTKQILWHEL